MTTSSHETIAGGATVQCSTHGTQQETFVCQHIAEGLQTKQRVGFFWTRTIRRIPARMHGVPDARSAYGQPTESGWEAEVHLKPKILCSACYDLAKIFHMGGDPWS
jgi:hypothetical protein